MSKIYDKIESSSFWAVHLVEGKTKIDMRTVTTTSKFNKAKGIWIKSEPITTWESPEQRGLTKTATFYILTYDTVPSLKKRGLIEKLFFKQKVTATIKDNPDNAFLYITFNDSKMNIQGELVAINKYYLRDINKGFITSLPLNDCDYCIVEKFEPELITAQEANELSKQTGYFYDAVETDAIEGDVFRTNVSKFINNPS
ncbi:MAG: hypothetical protein ABSC20_06295 [Candidatus Bathyarchaeia archaeon]|jgi:hypothetical protein